MANHRDQEVTMRWVLFWVFVGLFVLIVLGTLMVVFFEFGKLQQEEREILFRVFLVEIGLAVLALFYSIFGLKRKGAPEQTRVSRVRLNPEFADVRRLLGKTATLSASNADGMKIGDDIPCRILDDNGPYIPLNLPAATNGVYVMVQDSDKSYSGSFVVGTHLVDLIEIEA